MDRAPWVIDGSAQVLPWKTVVMPAVRVARDGFRGKQRRYPHAGMVCSHAALVTEDLVRYMQLASTYSTFLTDDPIWAEDFAPNGRHAATSEINTIANTDWQAHYSGSETLSPGNVMPSR